MPTCFQPRLTALLFASIILISKGMNAQCPTLGQNATFTSADCIPGSNPCSLCPGDQYTLNATGTNLHVGDCINWYVSDMPNFNPYNGQGTLLGCSELTSPPPNPCNPNPIFLGIMVNACGTEENNEFLGLWSGGGFNVSDLVINYNDSNNNGCGWQTPSAALQASIQAECPGAVFVGAGEVVPGNVPVVVFTSSAADFDYNFSGLCSTAGTFYVLQSDCAPAGEVFPNTGSGTVTTGVSIGCWSDDITYNLAQIANNNGAFVAEIPILGTIYGQAGCSWPNFPGLPGADPIVIVNPLDVTVTADQCNNGPFYIVGIYEPLPPGCPQTFTNYLSYTVDCPTPVLGTADLCSSVTNYNLVQIQDPAVPNGVWSGDGVNGTTFDATGLTGAVTLTFTPDSPCGTPATTTINVTEAPTATIDPILPVCAGGSTIIRINFTGDPNWSFNLFANGVFQNSFNTSDNPFEITVNPTINTTYTIQNLVNDAGCSGSNTSAMAMVSSSTATAVLSLVSNDSICSGSNAQVSIDFSGGVPPYDLVYSVNGIAQTPILDITQDPFLLSVTINNNSDIRLVSLNDNSGCSGTVSGAAFVWALPAPTATLVSDTVTICTGVTDTLVINLSGAKPFTFIYRVNGVNQPPVTTSLNQYKIPVTPNSGPVQYTLFSVTDSLCTGAVSGNYRINLIPVPTVTLSGTDTLCVGESTDLTFTFSNGTGPFIVGYTANGVAQPDIQTFSNPHIFTVTPTVNTVYLPVTFSANGCTGTVSGLASIAVPPSPVATISGGGQICQGGNGATVTITMSGTAPFTFIYSANNIAQAPITTMQNTYTFTVNPSVGTAYRLVSFHDAVCSGTFSGIAQVFVFVPASANMSGSAVFCDSAVTNVVVDFNGSGPFTIEYTINNVLQPPVFTSDDPYLIPVHVTSTTTYALTNVESPGCIGTPTGTAVITVNHPPSYANVNLNCNAAQNNYTVTFTVLNATPPLTLLSGSGTFSGNVFTSTAIPQGSGYNFVFHDVNDCGDITVSGPSTCNCATDAGAMNLTQLDVCVSQPAAAVFNGGFVDDGNDLLRYILHTNPALPLGTVLAWSSSPSFTFQAGMSAGTTYYISAIAGNDDGSGNVDLNDPCMKVAQGVPVVFHAAPTADIGVSTSTICQGDSLTINVAFTGSPDFSFTPTFSGVNQSTVNGIATGSYSFVVHPTQDMTVTVGQVGDQFCATGNPTGSVDIHVAPEPAFGAVQMNCDYSSLTYTLSFTTTGTPAFNISGVLASFNGTEFVSLPIPFNTPYQAILTDANHCGADTITGLGFCSCLNDAGIMNQTQINACQENAITVPDATMTVLEPGDVLLYILHDNAGTTAGNILAWSNMPTFSFGGGMLPNTVYYISSVVGNPDGAGMIDLMDPCLSIAAGTPVMWYPQPTAALTSGNFNLCPGQSQALIVSLTGTAPYSLTYTSNGNPFTAFPTQNLFSINAQLQQSATLILTSVVDAHGCMGTVTGSAFVTVHTTPTVVNQTYNCNFNDLTYIYQFDVATADLSTVNIANFPGTYDPTTGHFTSDPIPVTQPYAYTVTDAWGCGNFSASGTVNCSCTTNAGAMTPGGFILCAGDLVHTNVATGANLDLGDTLMYFLVTTISPNTWTVVGSSSTPDFGFNSATMTYGATYYLVAAAGNIGTGGLDLSDPCLSSAVGPTVVWREPIVATLSGTDTICAGASTQLQVAFTGSGPFTFTYSDGNGNQVVNNISQNPYNLSVSPAVSSTYQITGVSGAGFCPGTPAGTATVQVNTPPQAVNVQEICDFTTETVVLQFDISNGATPNSNYTITGISGAITDTTFTSISYPGSQPYSLTISDDIGCSTTLTGQPKCICTSKAGTLSNVQDACLPGGVVSAQSNGNSDLDPDDVVRYILCSDPATLPAGLLAQGSSPQFGFQSGMVAEQTYYIVVAVGNAQGNGDFDFNDPCHSLSSGVPVVFHNPPTASIAGNTSVCPGSSAGFVVQFSGAPPFSFTYAINGTTQPALVSPSSSFTLLSANIQHDQTFTLLSVQDAHCTGTVSGEAIVTAIAQPEGALAGPALVCVGDTATLTLSLSGGSAYNVIISGGTTPIALNGVQNGATVEVAPTSTTTYTLSTLVATGNTCTPILGNGITVTADQVTANGILSTYNGFNVSCPNSTDGSIDLTVITGQAPVNAVWSNGAGGLSLDNLTGGNYQVTLTDAAGCTWEKDFEIAAPPELGIGFETEAPDCFGEDSGKIIVSSITGGAGPFQLLLNGENQGPADNLPLELPRLISGDYVIGVEDANGCVSDTITTIDDPIQLKVDLGRDTLISFGDSLLLQAVHNAAQVDTFIWTPKGLLQDPDSLSSWIRPLKSYYIDIYLRDENGCVATDQLLVLVEKERRVYVPNVFNPHSGQLNDVVTVWAGAEVVKVHFLRIFDRWGELVFENEQFAPNDRNMGWNGKFQGEYVDPAVFVYVVKVEYINGETEIFKGDITVVR